jgi:hypothetical protein
LIGPGGVFVIDSKLYSGKLHLAPGGALWHGRYPLAPVLRAVPFEADQAAQLLATPDVEVVPLVAVHGASVPWDKLVADGGGGRPAPARAAPPPARRARAGTGGRPGQPGTGPVPRRRLKHGPDSTGPGLAGTSQGPAPGHGR